MASLNESRKSKRGGPQPPSPEWAPPSRARAGCSAPRHTRHGRLLLFKLDSRLAESFCQAGARRRAEPSRTFYLPSPRGYSWRRRQPAPAPT